MQIYKNNSNVSLNTSFKNSEKLLGCKVGWTRFDFIYFLSDISARWVLFFFLLEGWDRNWEGEPPLHLSNKLLCLEELRLRNNLEEGSKKF